MRRRGRGNSKVLEVSREAKEYQFAQIEDFPRKLQRFKKGSCLPRKKTLVAIISEEKNAEPH